MYNLKELFVIIGSNHAHELWDGKISCSFTDAGRTLLTNRMNDSFNGYSFTLILSGHLTLESGGHVLDFKPNEMYTYYPGCSVHILSISDDYRAICLILDTSLAHDTQAFRNLIRASIIPISQFGHSKLTLSDDDARRLRKLMELFYEYIHQPVSLKNEILESLYSAFINDLISIQAFDKVRLDISRQTEEIFVSFYHLMQQHFIEQHGVAFYADRLNVSTNYLSRIVKRITGKTVVGCIDEMLAIEATWLLKSTHLTVAQIADRLHFATSPSFDKFYRRMRGCSPLSVRTS